MSPFPFPFHEIRSRQLAKEIKRNRRLTWALVFVTCLNLLSFGINVKQGSKTCTYEVVSGAQK